MTPATSLSPFVAAVLIDQMVPPETPPFNSWAQLVLFLVALGAVLRWVWSFIRELRQKRNGADSNALALLVARMEKSLDQVVVQQAAVTTALTGVAAILTHLSERIDNIPTKLDLKDGFQGSRHDMRNIITPLATGLQELEQAIRFKGGAP